MSVALRLLHAGAPFVGVGGLRADRGGACLTAFPRDPRVAHKRRCDPHHQLPVAPHLTDANHRGVLESARHKSKREVQEIVAALHPLPDVPATIRKLATPKSPSAPTSTARVAPAPLPIEAAARPGAPATAPNSPAVPPPTARPTVVAPLAPERFKVQFTVGQRTHDKLRRAQGLLRHSVPNGDPGGDLRSGADAARRSSGTDRSLRARRALVTRVSASRSRVIFPRR